MCLTISMLNQIPIVEHDGSPLAYFITFRCYGSWLHGDARGSVDPHQNQPGAPLLPADPIRHKSRRNQLNQPPMELGAMHRKTIDSTIREVCHHRRWNLYALSVRSNHVHVVVGAKCTPEMVMNSFKSWSTRRLREQNLVAKNRKVWSRHGSTRYLWTNKDMEESFIYTMEAQDKH